MHWDDHTGDKFTVGQFVSDLADSVASMQIGIANSVQQAAQYSNVSIDRQNGFMAISQDGLKKVTMNATNCFSVYSRPNTADDWTLVQELDANGLYSSILTGLNSTMYAEVGTGSNGFALYYKDNTNKTPFLKIWIDTDGYTHITTPGGKLDFSSDDQGNSSTIPNFPGYTGDYVLGNMRQHYQNGLLSGYGGTDGFTGDIYINTGGTNTVPFHYKNGVRRPRYCAADLELQIVVVAAADCSRLLPRY
ncbi:hypothetical protein [Ethanoligenens sp.]|uniref:hypothetical protein n=1 Tax=Ethanoligenens sp. TaxID=2099655 RepID=UPI0039ECF72D